MRSLRIPSAFLITGCVTLIALSTLACSGSSGPVTTVTTNLKEWSVSPSVVETPAGKVRFTGTNQGIMTHELALLSIDEDGQKHTVKEVEDIEVGKTKSFSATLKRGRYELACLIAPGEAGSAVNHYQEGMHTEFNVR